MTEKISSEREIQNEWKWKTKKKGKTHEKKIKEKKTERERYEMTEFQCLQRKTDRMTDGVLK